MNRIKTHRMVLAIITVAAIGFTIVTAMEGWEFWVPPLLIAGAIALWVVHFTQRGEETTRENLYFLYAVLAAFFHGVHETSLFDVAIVAAMILALFSAMDRMFMLNTILAEYVVIMVMQCVLAIRGGTVLNELGASSVALQATAVACIYLICRRSVANRLEAAEAVSRHETDAEQTETDMEDFLSNISHELRTPINVVNGMSALLIKEGAGEKAEAIRAAGIRLSNQVENIQDYTECKRESIIIEEENYRTDSLINDVVVSYRRYDDTDDLELVVDVEPSVPTMMRGDVRKLHKLFRHLLDNAVKFTDHGGIYIHVYASAEEYGVNLCFEVTDTGHGMSRKDIASTRKGLYQANKKRNRSTGGVGLGLAVVYGLTHAMGGFVRIESGQGRGTSVHIAVPQKVIDGTPCLKLNDAFSGDILFHVRSDKYRSPQVREFNRVMAVHLAMGLGCALYSAETVREVERLRKKLNVGYVFMGQEEYEANSAFFDELSRNNVTVAVSAHAGFRPGKDSAVIVMPKPLYGVPVTRILNGEREYADTDYLQRHGKPVFKGLRALVVDDEPMNLVVAAGLFSDYKMVTDTAGSGAEAIQKLGENEYDVVFMDHMMPEMDGVECMKRIREMNLPGKMPLIVALTANAVSGAREMFIREGIDGFIAKPIDIGAFERTMRRILPEEMVSFEGGDAT
ncbi:MAG: response regulator [Oscillospiraceae bacterium]|nr:response regulator [Oscillospiraceae bacterium]